MHIKQTLNVDHLLILIPNCRTEGRAAPGATRSPWAALPASWSWIYIQGSTGVAAFAPLLPKGKERMVVVPFYYLTWALHSELAILPELHIFPIVQLGLAAGEAI